VPSVKTDDTKRRVEAEERNVERRMLGDETERERTWKIVQTGWRL